MTGARSFAFRREVELKIPLLRLTAKIVVAD